MSKTAQNSPFIVLPWVNCLEAMTPGERNAFLLKLRLETGDQCRILIVTSSADDSLRSFAQTSTDIEGAIVSNTGGMLSAQTSADLLGGLHTAPRTLYFRRVTQDPSQLASLAGANPCAVIANQDESTLTRALMFSAQLGGEPIKFSKVNYSGGPAGPDCLIEKIKSALASNQFPLKVSWPSVSEFGATAK